MPGGATKWDPFGFRGGGSIEDAGSLATRVGTVITLASLPLAVVSALALLVGAASLATGSETVVEVLTRSPGAAGPVGGVLYVGVLGLLVGTWYLGVGLLLSGLYE